MLRCKGQDGFPGRDKVFFGGNESAAIVDVEIGSGAYGDKGRYTVLSQHRANKDAELAQFLNKTLECIVFNEVFYQNRLQLGIIILALNRLVARHEMEIVIT